MRRFQKPPGEFTHAPSISRGMSCRRGEAATPRVTITQLDAFFWTRTESLTETGLRILTGVGGDWRAPRNPVLPRTARARIHPQAGSMTGEAPLIGVTAADVLLAGVANALPPDLTKKEPPQSAARGGRMRRCGFEAEIVFADAALSGAVCRRDDRRAERCRPAAAGWRLSFLHATGKK